MKAIITQQARDRMKQAVLDAVKTSPAQAPLVIMLMPGHCIPLEYTSGAVLDHDFVKVTDPVLGWCSVVGKLAAEDRQNQKQVFSIPFGEIAWIDPKIREVK